MASARDFPLCPARAPAELAASALTAPRTHAGKRVHRGRARVQQLSTRVLGSNADVDPGVWGSRGNLVHKCYGRPHRRPLRFQTLIAQSMSDLVQVLRRKPASRTQAPARRGNAPTHGLVGGGRVPLRHSVLPAYTCLRGDRVVDLASQRVPCAVLGRRVACRAGRASRPAASATAPSTPRSHCWRVNDRTQQVRTCLSRPFAAALSNRRSKI